MKETAPGNARITRMGKEIGGHDEPVEVFAARLVFPNGPPDWITFADIWDQIEVTISRPTEKTP